MHTLEFNATVNLFTVLFIILLLCGRQSISDNKNIQEGLALICRLCLSNKNIFAEDSLHKSSFNILHTINPFHYFVVILKRRTYNFHESVVLIKTRPPTFIALSTCDSKIISNMLYTAIQIKPSNINVITCKLNLGR